MSVKPEILSANETYAASFGAKSELARTARELIPDRAILLLDAGSTTHALAELLDMPDNDLWDVVSGRSERYDPRLGSIVARLRAV